jgi:chemotaxis signal transduction protein
MSTQEPRSTSAWLLDCGGGTRVAVALSTLLHLIEDNSLLFRVPVVPRHLAHVLLWQQRVFPVVDLALQLTGSTPAGAHTYICMLGWRNSSDQSDYGALLVRELPRRIHIPDQSLATPTPQLAGRWQGLALTYFALAKQVIPIIAPAALFESPARTDRGTSNVQAQRTDMRGA